MRVAIGLGSSLGQRRRTLERALRRLDATDGMRLLRGSRWYMNPPMKGGSARGWFLNGVGLFEADLSPRTILARCRDLEESEGRRRARFWGDRPLDLDVLVVEGVVSDDPVLRLPHPGVGTRPFVWWPLHEVWPEAARDITDTPPSSRGIVPVGVVARPPTAR